MPTTAEKRRDLVNGFRTGRFPALGVRRRKLSTEIMEQMRQENRRLTEEIQVLRTQLDRLEGKEFLEDMHHKALKGLYQALRLLLRQAPKSKKAKKVLREVRGVLVEAGVKLPSELRRPKRRSQLDSTIKLG